MSLCLGKFPSFFFLCLFGLFASCRHLVPDAREWTPTKHRIEIIKSDTLPRNAEAGIGLICACLPVLNVLYAHYRRETSSQRYYDQGSDIQMRARKSGNTSHLASHRTNVPDFGSQTDQSHLISFAGAPEVANSIYEEDGIRKTVAMSQTVENAASGSR